MDEMGDLEHLPAGNSPTGWLEMPSQVGDAPRIFYYMIPVTIKIVKKLIVCY